MLQMLQFGLASRAGFIFNLCGKFSRATIPWPHIQMGGLSNIMSRSRRNLEDHRLKLLDKSYLSWPTKLTGYDWPFPEQVCLLILWHEWNLPRYTIPLAHVHVHTSDITHLANQSPVFIYAFIPKRNRQPMICNGVKNDFGILVDTATSILLHVRNTAHFAWTSLQPCVIFIEAV
jgi:hypothetical protein